MPLRQILFVKPLYPPEMILEERNQGGGQRRESVPLTLAREHRYEKNTSAFMAWFCVAAATWPRTGRSVKNPSIFLSPSARSSRGV